VTPAFVLDCSVAIAWLFPDDATRACGAILERLETERALVPGFWFLEVTNVLAVSERTRRLNRVKTSEFLNLLRRFDLVVDDEVELRAFDHLLPLCRAHKLTGYDAAYLDLAMRRSLPMATLDVDLRKAAKSVGVGLLGI
jgi:predicted nucleic acid-binding protein